MSKKEEYSTHESIQSSHSQSGWEKELTQIKEVLKNFWETHAPLFYGDDLSEEKLTETMNIRLFLSGAIERILAHLEVVQKLYENQQEQTTREAFSQLDEIRDILDEVRELDKRIPAGRIKQALGLLLFHPHIRSFDSQIVTLKTDNRFFEILSIGLGEQNEELSISRTGLIKLETYVQTFWEQNKELIREMGKRRVEKEFHSDGKSHQDELESWIINNFNGLLGHLGLLVGDIPETLFSIEQNDQASKKIIQSLLIIHECLTGFRQRHCEIDLDTLRNSMERFLNDPMIVAFHHQSIIMKLQRAYPKYHKTN